MTPTLYLPLLLNSLKYTAKRLHWHGLSTYELDVWIETIEKVIAASKDREGTVLTHNNPARGVEAAVAQKLPIDRPCSACSAGDFSMKYHDHEPPFRPCTSVGDYCYTHRQFKSACKKFGMDTPRQDGFVDRAPEPPTSLCQADGFSESICD